MLREYVVSKALQEFVGEDDSNARFGGGGCGMWGGEQVEAELLAHVVEGVGASQITMCLLEDDEVIPGAPSRGSIVSVTLLEFVCTKESVAVPCEPLEVARKGNKGS